ncbi:hypothetical protein MA16_Dca012691 [Dendrobium catenatum]|uniref:Disease resistance N-terminal domain-containing protein n=1 Tax=Dendrobium catenatum TaxID=906689 RepID=A0A2I0WPM3_9ASPA|nr:hypothetical protein MA16_Dca012691 [Dendrobium catenatum]
MEGTISLIISNLLSSLERLSQFMPIFTSLAASSSSSSSSTVEEEMIIDVNSMQEGLMEDLSRLLRILQRIQALLHDAAKREVQDKQTKLWLSELRKVAYDAEDVLDQYDYQIIKTQVEGMTTTEEKPSLQRKKVDDDDDDFYGDQDGSKLNLKQVLRLDLDEFPNKDSDNSYDKDCQELDSIKEAILNWSRQRKV